MLLLVPGSLQPDQRDTAGFTGLVAVGAAAITAASATQAVGHPVLPGVTGFPSMMLHPLLLEHQLLCVMAAGLILARAAPQRPLSGLALITASVIGGNAARGFLPMYGFYVPFVLTAIVATGLLVVSFERPAFAAAAICLIALGAAIGLDTSAEGPGIWHVAEAIAASLLTTLIVATLIGVAFRSPARAWVIILARIIAAWITAAALMMLALTWA